MFGPVEILVPYLRWCLNVSADVDTIDHASNEGKETENQEDNTKDPGNISG